VLVTSVVTLSIATVAMALSVPLTPVANGTVGGTLTFTASLTGIVGITQIGSITIVDDGTPVGGAAGVFSGFDLDAILGVWRRREIARSRRASPSRRARRGRRLLQLSAHRVPAVPVGATLFWSSERSVGRRVKGCGGRAAGRSRQDANGRL